MDKVLTSAQVCDAWNQPRHSLQLHQDGALACVPNRQGVEVQAVRSGKVSDERAGWRLASTPVNELFHGICVKPQEVAQLDARQFPFAAPLVDRLL
jgi:hypothetical protein